MSWSVPFHVWMPYAAYFVGGIATHQYSHVPEYPRRTVASGSLKATPRVYQFVELGTPVVVR